MKMEDKHNLLRNIAYNWLSTIRESEDYIDEFNIVDFLMKDEKEAGRREVLERVEDHIQQFGVLTNLAYKNILKDLTSDPQTPQKDETDSLSDNGNNLEESSSEDIWICECGLINTLNHKVCVRCKQKQENKQ